MRTFVMGLCTTLLMGGSGDKPGNDTLSPTLNDLIPGGATYRFAENLYGVQWWGDICIKPDIDSLFAVDPKTGKETLLFTREALNRVLAKYKEPDDTDIFNNTGKLHHLYHIQFPRKERKEVLLQANFFEKSYSGNVSYNRNKETGETTVTKKEKNNDASNTKFFIYDFGKDEARNILTITPKNDDIDYSIEGNHAAYTIDNNLYVDNRQVTDEPEGVVCGQSVHRNEFGIHKGTFWSPKGNRLAFYRMDERMVAEYPLVDTTPRIAGVRNIRYPMAGMTSHKVTIGVYNPTTKETRYLETGDPTDRYFTNISWSPDEKTIYLIELNRDQNHSKLCSYDAETGKLLATLVEEEHPKYIEPQRPITFLPWDSTKFIYQSQHSGYNHLYIYDITTRPAKAIAHNPLYLYDTTGQPVKPLTSGDWQVQRIVGFDEKNKYLFIESTECSPLQSNIYRVDVRSGKRTPVGNAHGVHYGVLSASGTYMLDTYSAPDVPRNIDVIDTRKGTSVNLLTAENPFKDFRMPTVETGTIKAADSVIDLYYRMVKPIDFDPAKQYPAIVYVYGGPHAQMVTDGFQYGARGWDLYMPAKGYIMFTLDNRGSSNRGLEFENCTFRRLGIEECKDQVKGVEFLKSLPYIDGSRIGVHGWSFGGHMTTALMLRHPELFKAGVAGGPVIDWKYYEVMYGERYMDTPITNPEGYGQSNLNKLAGNLKGHLLLIHDDQDETCVPQHTLSFLKACVEAGTYPDLFIYPGHKHNVMGRDRVHLHEKITRYFEEHLR